MSGKKEKDESVDYIPENSDHEESLEDENIASSRETSFSQSKDIDLEQAPHSDELQSFVVDDLNDNIANNEEEYSDEAPKKKRKTIKETKPRKSVRLKSENTKKPSKKTITILKESNSTTKKPNTSKVKANESKKSKKDEKSFYSAKSDRNLIRIEGQLENINSIDEIKFDKSNNRSLSDNFEESKYAIDNENIEESENNDETQQQNKKKRKRKTKAQLAEEEKWQKEIALVRMQIDHYNHCIRQFQSLLSPYKIDIEVGSCPNSIVIEYNTNNSKTKSITRINNIVKTFNRMKNGKSSSILNRSRFIIDFDLCENYLKKIENTSMDIDDNDDQEEKNSVAHLLDFNKQNEYYISRRKIVYNVTGFFNEELKFGEYYVFMCEPKFYAGKRKFSIVHRVTEEYNLCELNFDLIDKLYGAFLSKESIMLQKNCDLMNFQIQVKKKYKNSQLKSTKTNINAIPEEKDYALMFFNILDNDLKIWTYKWFELLFTDCEYLKNKFISEIEYLYSPNTLNMLRLCSTKSLFKILTMIGEKSPYLCFFDKLPKEIKTFAIASNLQNKIELGIEKYSELLGADLKKLIKDDFQSEEDFDNSPFKHILIAYYYKINFSLNYTKCIPELDNILDDGTFKIGSYIYKKLEDSKMISFDDRITEYRLNSDLALEKSIFKFVEYIFQNRKQFYFNSKDIDESLYDYMCRLKEKQDSETSPVSEEIVKANKDSSVSMDTDNNLEIDVLEQLTVTNQLKANIAKSFLKNPLTIVVSNDMEDIAEHYRDLICDIDAKQEQNCLVVGIDTGIQRAQTYSIENVIFRLLQTKNSFIKVCQLALDTIEKEELTPVLSKQEVEKLQDTSIYKYFKDKKKLRILAQLLEMAFFKKIDGELISEACVYCSLIQKKILIVKDAELITSELFVQLIDLFPHIKKILLIGKVDNKTIVNDKLIQQSNKSNILKEFEKLFQKKNFYFYENQNINFSTTFSKSGAKNFNSIALNRKYSIAGSEEVNIARNFDKSDENCEDVLKDKKSAITKAPNLKLIDLLVEQIPISKVSYGMTYKTIQSQKKQNLFMFNNINFTKKQLKLAIGKIIQSLLNCTKSNCNCLVEHKKDVKDLLKFNNIHIEENLCIFCPTNRLRTLVAQLCFEKIVDIEKEMIKLIDGCSKEKDIEQLLKKYSKWWKKGGVFDTYSEYKKVFQKRLKIGYKENQFYVGDSIVLTSSHPGQKTIAFCPFQSDSLKKDLTDTIELIFDYNTFTGECEFLSSTNELKKSEKYTKRFLVLKQTKKIIWFNNYFKHYIKYAFTRNYQSDASPATSLNVLLTGKKYKSYLNATKMFSMLKNTKSKIFLLIQNNEKSPCTVEESIRFENSNKQTEQKNNYVNQNLTGLQQLFNDNLKILRKYENQ